jgi:type VI secretion system protein ImpJ
LSAPLHPVAPLLFHEGMLLAPQHFQRMTLRQEQLALLLATTASPYHWGVAGLEHDASALPAGLLRILALDALLPDGLAVQHRAERDPVLEIDLSPWREAAARAPVTVHLVVPAGRAIAAADGAPARFEVIETPDIPDEAGTGEPLSLQVLRPRLGLEVTTGPRQRPPSKFIGMPLMRCTFDGHAWQRAPFVPPHWAVAERSPLARLVQDMARRARERALGLVHQGAGTSSGGSPGAARAGLEGLAAGLPALEAVLAIGTAHPFTLFVEICRYAGMLAVLATGQVPPVPPRYDHDDVLPLFEEVIGSVGQVLDRLGRSLVAHRFEDQGDRFSLALEPAWTSGRLLLAVIGPHGTADSALAQWMDTALIATRDRSGALWDLRVRGAARAPLVALDDLDIALPRGAALFAVEPDSAFITQGDTLEVWPTQGRQAGPRPTEILLYAGA